MPPQKVAKPSLKSLLPPEAVEILFDKNPKNGQSDLDSRSKNSDFDLDSRSRSQHDDLHSKDGSRESSRSSSTKERTLLQAMRFLLVDDSLSDMALQSSDGKLFRANSCILAARSGVFRMMAAMAKEDGAPVSIPLEGFILKAVLEYIYTEDETCLLDPTLDVRRETILRILLLNKAAHTLNLNGLKELILAKLETMIEKQPELVVVLLEASNVQEGSTYKHLKRLAWKWIRNQPRQVLTPKSVSFLDVSLLGEIIKDGKLNANELFLFQMIVWWAEVASTTGESTEEKHTRTIMAQGVTRHIRFELIHSKELNSVVAESGFLDRDQIAQAQKVQRSKFGNDASIYLAPRYMALPQWMKLQSDTLQAEVTGGTKVDRLYHPTGITSGVYEWAVNIVNLPNNNNGGSWNEIILAFATKTQKLMWGFSSTGHCRAIEREGFLVRYSNKPTFGTGDKVVLQLNLGNGTMNGAISASVNNGPNVLLCTDVLPELREEDGSVQALYPVALVSPGACVKCIRLQEN